MKNQIPQKWLKSLHWPYLEEGKFIDLYEMKIFWGCQNKALFIDLTSMAKLWLDPSDITEAPVVKPDSELIQEVVLPVDLILVTPFRSKSPVLRCFFSLRPCKINNILVLIQILAKLFTVIKYYYSVNQVQRPLSTENFFKVYHEFSNIETP